MSASFDSFNDSIVMSVRLSRKKQSHMQCSFAFFSKRISVTATCVIIVYLVHIRAVCSDTTPHV